MALFNLLEKYKNRHLKVMNNENLATEMLTELKSNAKRWFIIAMIELGLILGIVGGFLWYNSLPVNDTTSTEVTQDAEDSGNNNFIGGDYNGTTENQNN